MIVVSIARGRHKHLIAEHKHLVEHGVPLVELRLDYINGQINLKRVLPDRPGPVIVTIRREREGGRYKESEESRLMLLRSAIVAGVDYIDLEEDAAAEIPRYGDTKRIISLHDFHKTPDDLEAVHARLAKLDPDVVKIATQANHPHDNLRMLKLVKNAKVPTVGICMGEMGIPTRLLAGRYGAPFSYATFHHERALGPGQLSYQQMTELYDYDHIDNETEVFGVVADPVGHSLSPLVHNTAFRHLKENKVYLPFRVPREDLGSFFDDAKAFGIRGLSITIPHKEAVLRYLTTTKRAVAEIGAANTLLFDGSQVAGHNTDYRAAMDSLAAAMGEPDYPDLFAGKEALVLGAGGAAKAIVYGMKRRGAQVTIASRTHERAKKLAEHFRCRAVEWNDRNYGNVDVLVNCTPLGMHPNVNESPCDKRLLRSGMLVFDTVYNPERTLLIKEAREAGCNVATGVEMFVRQAALQFEMFTEKPAPTEIMRDAMKRAIGPARR